MCLVILREVGGVVGLGNIEVNRAVGGRICIGWAQEKYINRKLIANMLSTLLDSNNN